MGVERFLSMLGGLAGVAFAVWLLYSRGHMVWAGLLAAFIGVCLLGREVR